MRVERRVACGTYRVCLPSPRQSSPRIVHGAANSAPLLCYTAHCLLIVRGQHELVQCMMNAVYGECSVWWNLCTIGVSKGSTVDTRHTVPCAR
jgi:hypothetical protein